MTPTYAGVREDCANTRETVYRRHGLTAVEGRGKDVTSIHE